MSKKFIWGLAGLLVIVGLIVGFMVLRNIKQKPAKTVEQSSNISASDVKNVSGKSDNILKQGSFEDGDAIHQASGKAQIIKTDQGPVLKFSDFSVVDGPDVHVYLSPNKAGEELGEFISLGKIKSHTGDQVYELPENYEDYQSVVIWCRAFATTFAKANLE